MATLTGKQSRIASALLIALLSLLSVRATPSLARGANAGQASSITRFGVRVTIRILGGLVHPRDSLALVEASVKNVSRHDIDLCGNCVDGAIIADVFDATGKLLYPPPVPVLYSVTGGGPLHNRPQVVPPGGVLAGDQYVILRGRFVRAVARVGASGQHVVQASAKEITFVNEKGPHLALTLAPTVSVAIANAGTDEGPIFYSYSYRCAEENGTGIGGYDWATSDTTTIQPEIDSSCGKLLEFHLVAGALNQPIGRVDYAAPPANPGAVSEPLMRATANRPKSGGRSVRPGR